DPRWGRIEETYGEDPYLAARMGVAAVRGFQGGGTTVGPSHVIATLKHMTGHGQPESGTNVGPAPYGERTLRDFFLPPFEAAITEAHAKSVMPSYNEVDGVPSHANRWLLHDVLRGEWGFDGVIVSDWFAIPQLADLRHVATDRADAARRALAAGVDVELPDVQAYGTLVDQVRQGRVPEATIDSVVRRLLRPKFELGLFENPFVDPGEADRISGAAASRTLALDAARQAITLLKNDRQLLPLAADRLSRVAVIGPHAAEVLLGGYSGGPRHTVSILEGIRARLGARAAVEYAEGTRITEDSTFTREPQPHMGGTRSHARWGADRVVLADRASNAQRRAAAVAEALFGDIDPGGKLPVTVARQVGQLPMFYNRKPSARRGYLFDTTEPLFPFGYGLSYTTFAYANLRVTPARIGPSPRDRTSVSVDVTNTGKRTGDEVVQLYIRDAVSWA